MTNVDLYFDVVEKIAAMSKDPRTKVGAIALDDDRTILATGYNGFPRGVTDNPDYLNDRKEKHKRIIHAEANLVAQAARTGANLKGSTVLVLGMYPCSQCAGLLIQAGVKEIIVKGAQSSDWNTDVAGEMLEEAGVKVTSVKRAPSEEVTAVIGVTEDGRDVITVEDGGIKTVYYVSNVVMYDVKSE